MAWKEFLTIALAAILTVSRAEAGSSFEGTQDGVTRAAYKLYGGSVEELIVSSQGQVFAGLLSPNGTFCSLDGGETWIAPDSGNDVANVAAAALDESTSTIYIIGGVFLYRSTDGCRNWTKITGTSNNYGSTLAFGHGVLLVAARGGTLERSPDNGSSFQVVSLEGSSYIKKVTASPAADTFFLIATVSSVNKLYQSGDGGLTWNDTGKNDVKDVAVNPTNENDVVIVNNNGTYEESANGGSTWGSLSGGPPSASAVRFVGNRLYLDSYYTDNRTDWTHPSNATGASVVGHFAGQTGTGVIYAASERGVARSDDGGVTWTDKVNGMLGVKVYGIAQSNDKNTVFLGTGSGLAKTSDFLNSSGATWAFPVTINPARPSQAVYSVLFDKNDQQKIYAGLMGGQLFVSGDGGSTWNEASVDSAVQGGDITDIKQGDDNILYASYKIRDIAEGGVLRSTDGSSWTSISAGQFNAPSNKLAVVGSTVFAAVGYDQSTSDPAKLGIYSYNGTSWSKLPSSVFPDRVVSDILRVGNTIFATTVRTNNLGETETGGVFRSKDQGATWTDLTGIPQNGLHNIGAPSFRSVAVDPENTDIVYVAHGRPAFQALIYQSLDGGDTWKQYYQGLADEVPDVMLVDALMAGFNTGLFGFTGNSAGPTPTPTPTPTVAPTPRTSLSAKLQGRRLLCTLKKDNAVLKNKRVSAEKAAPRSKKFKRFAQALTSKKGVATFSLKEIARGTSVRCRYTSIFSAAKKVK